MPFNMNQLQRLAAENPGIVAQLKQGGLNANAQRRLAEMQQKGLLGAIDGGPAEDPQAAEQQFQETARKGGYDEASAVNRQVAGSGAVSDADMRAFEQAASGSPLGNVLEGAPPTESVTGYFDGPKAPAPEPVMPAEPPKRPEGGEGELLELRDDGPVMKGLMGGGAPASDPMALADVLALPAGDDPAAAILGPQGADPMDVDVSQTDDFTGGGAPPPLSKDTQAIQDYMTKQQAGGMAAMTPPADPTAQMGGPMQGVDPNAPPPMPPPAPSGAGAGQQPPVPPGAAGAGPMPPPGAPPPQAGPPPMSPPPMGAQGMQPMAPMGAPPMAGPPPQMTPPPPPMGALPIAGQVPPQPGSGAPMPPGMPTPQQIAMMSPQDQQKLMMAMQMYQQQGRA